MDGNVRIGTLSILGKPVSGKRYGLFVAKGGVTGLFDGVDPRNDQTAIPGQPGDFDVPGTLASRTVVVPGLAMARTGKELQHLGRSVTGLLAQGESAKLSVEYADLTVWTWVRLGAAPKFSPKRGGGTIADFQVTLWAPNPRLFGDTAKFASGSDVSHGGNYPSTPLFTVSGTMPGGYTINGPAGKKFIVTAPVVPALPHTIDMATGLLLVGGSPVYGAVSQGDVWAVPPAQSVSWTGVPASGSGSFTASVVDTYV